MMGDKANTKHGNIVAIGPFVGSNPGSEMTDSVDVYKFYWTNGGGDYAADEPSMPFNGHISAITFDGDYPSAGTESVVVRINGTVCEPTRLAITQAHNSKILPSAQSVSFSAGDYLNIATTASANFAPSDTGNAFLFIYVMFSNV